MAELLIELYSEEIPANIQESAVKKFEFLLLDNFKEAGLHYLESEVYWSPMRLTVCVNGIDLKSKDVKINRRGPRIDANEAAINGFARGLEVNVKDLIIEKLEKGEFYFYKSKKEGINAEIIIEDAIKTIISNFPWKKSMRWGDNQLKWIRPLHNILCVFDSSPIKFNVENIHSNALTYGHRYLAPDSIEVNNKENYIEQLIKSHVIVNPEDRKKAILSSGNDLTKNLGLIFNPKENLLEEVCNIIETPFLFIGSFEEEYLSLPNQILELTMIKQQKYFPLYNQDGSLSKNFLGVSNIPIKNNLQIIKGNERVLKARLSDARFFFDNDMKKGLNKLSRNLENIIFHRSLGTMKMKMGRVSFIVEKYSKIFNADIKLALISTKLCKADLCSEVVYEMPELQGRIGSIYALAEELPNQVSVAINEHYSPLGPSDKCPSIEESAVLSLSDKLDSLVGFIAIDMKATGSKDPFGLRRSCLGVIRILLERKIRLSISDIINDSYDSYSKQGINLKLSKDETNKSTIHFIYERLRVFLKDKGLSQSALQAVFEVSNNLDIVNDVNKVEALDKLMSDPKGKEFLSILKRVRRILSIEENKDNVEIKSDVQEKLLVQKEEITLYKMHFKYSEIIKDLIVKEEYTDAMKSFAVISTELEKFFENVQVNIENKDLRINRLKLLSMIRETFLNFADFSLIEAENEVT